MSEAKDVDVDLIEIPDSELEITQTEACENAFESDEDLPNYSDIEAMVTLDFHPYLSCSMALRYIYSLVNNAVMISDS